MGLNKLLELGLPSSVIGDFGFTSSPYDSALFVRKTERGSILLFLYVDDMIITGDDLAGISDLKQSLSAHFEMKDLGSFSYFLGLEISSASSTSFSRPLSDDVK